MKWTLAPWGERILRLHSKSLRSLKGLWAISSIRRKLVAFPIFLLILPILYSWTVESNSCAFYTFFVIILFDVLGLFGDILSQSFLISGKPSTSLSFGYARIEVLSHFSTLCLGLLLNFWGVKKCLEILLRVEDHQIHTGRFIIPGLLLGGLIHFFLSFSNSAFLKVYKVSSTTTSLQKYFQGVSVSFGLSLSSSSAFFMSSPFAVLGILGISTVLLVTGGAFHTGHHWLDFVGGLIIVLGIFDTLWPLTYLTCQVLLQTVPAHVLTQLDKCLREALTIDGVLEFRDELFWTLTYGQLAGTLHVRVRRDANEQMVLAKIYDKIQPLVPHLTVQITKDDLGRAFIGNFPVLFRDYSDSTSSPLQQVITGSDLISPISAINNTSGGGGPQQPHPLISSTPRFYNNSSLSEVLDGSPPVPIPLYNNGTGTSTPSST